MIEFPISPHYKDLNQKIMLKFDMGSHINCISLETFQRLFPHQQLTKSMLLLENYSNSPVSIIVKFKAFIQWKGKAFHQEFHVMNANPLPNLLSRDASFQMEVLQTCFAVTGKEIPPWTNKVITVLNHVWASHHLQCLPLLQEVWVSHHLPKRRYWRYMQMSLTV